MYDVSSPKSLQSLKKWWNEFRDRAPVHEGEEEDFCCVVVGNKVDVGSANGQANGDGVDDGAGKARTQANWKISEEEATAFLEQLIPPTASAPTTPTGDTANADPGPPTSATPNPSASLPEEETDTQPNVNGPSSPPRPRSKSESQTQSIYISDNRHHAPSSLSPPSRGRALFPAALRSRSPSSTRLGYSIGTKNSLSSVATRESFYHTPASSFYESARSSPIPFPRDGSTGSSQQDRLGVGASEGARRGERGARTTSLSSTASSSALTITQSLFLRTASAPAASMEPLEPPSSVLPPLERRPKLLFTSAKTGEGVANVFEYVARRVVVKWEWERRESEGDGWEDGDQDDTIRIGMRNGEGLGRRTARRCCT